MAQRRLFRGGVLFLVCALGALSLPSCFSGPSADAPNAGSQGGFTSGAPGPVPVAGGPISVAGAPTQAGASASGGEPNSSVGGAAGAAGAAVASAGAAPVCTDKPPNNGDTCAHAVEYNWCAESCWPILANFRARSAHLEPVPGSGRLGADGQRRRQLDPARADHPARDGR